MKLCRTVKVKVPGSCGELAQGFWRGEPILITCPIKIFATCEVSDKFFCVKGLGEKSLQMLEKVSATEKNFGVKLTSDLPRGKGMASSSADVAAVAKAVTKFFGEELSAEKIAELAAQIEPTDGVFFDGVVAMNPVTGKFVKNIALAEKLSVAIFDYGGEVDTLKFNRRSDFVIAQLADVFNFELAEKSALANQKILHKPALAEIITFAKNLGALGVNAAHSGTVIGIFFRAADEFIAKKISEIQIKFDCIKFLTLTEMIAGGFYQ